MVALDLKGESPCVKQRGHHNAQLRCSAHECVNWHDYDNNKTSPLWLADHACGRTLVVQLLLQVLQLLPQPLCLSCSIS